MVPTVEEAMSYDWGKDIELTEVTSTGLEELILHLKIYSKTIFKL
jgi:hypothetical protein